MRTLISLIAFLLVVMQASAQPVLSNCAGMPLLKETYYLDIKSMAIDHMNTTGTADTALIEPRQKYIDTVLQGLYAIYNTGYILAADTIFNKICLHRDLKFYNRSFEVYAPGAPWIENWKAGDVSTGVTELDALLSYYNFTVKYHIRSGGIEYGALTTDSVINYRAFADTLKKFKWVSHVEMGGPGSTGGGDWEDIWFSRDTGISNYSFITTKSPGPVSLYRKWHFAVDGNCNVSLVERVRTGDQQASPPFRYCNLFPVAVPELAAKKEIEIYPNPAEDYIEVAGSFGAGKYQVRDAAGRIVSIGNWTGKINISQLPPGLYILHINGSVGSFIGKFLKQ